MLLSKLNTINNFVPTFSKLLPTPWRYLRSSPCDFPWTSCPPASSFPGFSGLKSIHSFIPVEIHHLPSPLVLWEITTRNCYQFGNPTPGSDKRHLNSLLLIVSSLIRIQPTAPNIQKSLYWTMKVPIPLETNCPSIQHQSSPYRSRSGLYSPAVPTIPRETTVLRRSKHPPLKLVLIEHSVFPPITRNPKTLTASSQPFFSWTPHSSCPRLQQN